MLCQFNPASPGAIDEIKSATGGGVEFTFEMAGSVRALDLAYRITRRGGTNGDGRAAAARPHVCAAPVNLVAEERTVKGSYIGTCVLTSATCRATSSSIGAAGCGWTRSISGSIGGGANANSG